MTLLIIIAVCVIRCGPAGPTLPEDSKLTLALSSPVFQGGETIPTKYTCQGEDISPPLTWAGPPPETRSFALIMDDPDAPGGRAFTHWVLFNLPADTRELPEAIPRQNELENGAVQGRNDFGAIGYGGPCPPAGPAHHYRFTIFALDRRLDLAAGASRNELVDAVTGHILAQGHLIGMYQR
ncbi:MAG: YbhB/YbcL family Raf kinase inhibitor-like protein [Dehalococcoidia bacterium]